MSVDAAADQLAAAAGLPQNFLALLPLALLLGEVGCCTAI
jgi:hypothetical protein